MIGEKERIMRSNSISNRNKDYNPNLNYTKEEAMQWIQENVIDKVDYFSMKDDYVDGRILHIQDISVHKDVLTIKNAIIGCQPCREFIEKSITKSMTEKGFTRFKVKSNIAILERFFSTKYFFQIEISFLY